MHICVSCQSTTTWELYIFRMNYGKTLENM